MTRRRNGCSARWVAGWLALSTLVVGAARGQGSTGVLPRDLAVADAAHIANQLDLSPAQRQRWLELHEQYASNMSHLYDDEILWLVEHLHVLQSNASEQDRQRLREFFRRHRLVRQRMAVFEGALFDELDSVLSDEQRVIHVHLRSRRARERCSIRMLTWFALDAARVDIADHVLETDKAAMNTPAIRDLIAAYEDQATRLWSEVLDASVESYASLDDELERMGHRPAELGDMPPAEMQAAIADAAQRLTERAYETSVRMHRLNRQSVEQLSALWPAGEGRALRTWFIREAYPAAWTHAAPIERGLDALMRDTPPDAPSASSILDLRDSHRAQVDPVVRRMCLEIDEYRAAHSPFGFDPQANAEHRERLAEMADRLRRIQARMLERVEADLGHEIAARVRLAVAGDQEHAPNDAPPPVTAGDGSALGAFLPAPIDRNGAMRLLDRLEIEGSTRMSLEQAWQAYRDEYGAVVASAPRRWPDDDGTGGATLDEVAEACRAAFDQLAALDAAWFRRLEQSVRAGDDRDAVSDARRDRRIDRMLALPPIDLGYALARFHVFAVVDAAGLQGALPIEAQRRLRAYEASLLDHLGRLRAAALASEVAKARLALAKGRLGPGASDAERDAYRAALDAFFEADQTFKRAELRLNRLNEDAVEAVVAVCDDDQGAALREAWRRIAAPDAHRHAVAIEHAVDRALSAPGVESNDRQRIVDIGHRSTEMAQGLTERILRLRAEMRDTHLAGASGAGVPVDRQAVLERRRFELRELAARVEAMLGAPVRDAGG